MITETNTIAETASLIDALGRLNLLTDRAHMTLFVLDGTHVTGTLTDGDIRRGLLQGLTLESSVAEACCRKFRHLSLADSPRRRIEILRECREKGIALVPEIDADGALVRIIDLTSTHTLLPLRAVLMAGGKGERLRPLTLDTPKPLLQIEGKAIIDYNIEALAAAGIRDITVCTRYLAEQIEAHFASPFGPRALRVKCVREREPLGTIGAVALTTVALDDGDTLVMNSDLLTSISYEDLYLRHIDTGADITIATVPFQVSVPFAILSFDPADSERVVALEEKPTYSHYANAGIYIFNNRILRRIAPATRTDATDLIEQAIAEGARVCHYTIKGTWIDVGSPTDFRQASELMKHHRAMDSRT
ncbi:MAG: NTP transferase domain-containing protein [Muribaculaceae bacterium]|nr:NTP transferase domain-containing protein [Muribaculaceae bacterium]